VHRAEVSSLHHSRSIRGSKKIPRYARRCVSLTALHASTGPSLYQGHPGSSERRRSETPPHAIRATSAHCSPVSVLYVGSLSRFTFILVHFAENWRNPHGWVVTTWRTAVLPLPSRAQCPQTEILNQRTYHFQQPLFGDSAPSSAIIIHCTLIKKNPPWDSLSPINHCMLVRIFFELKNLPQNRLLAAHGRPLPWGTQRARQSVSLNLGYCSPYM